MTRVRTASRLHFGLFALPGKEPWPDREGRPALSPRAFGGAGLMIEQPGLIVSAERASSWSAEGPLAERALDYARQVAATLGLGQCQHIRVEQAPPEHVGLGTGTQLGLAVARAVLGEGWPAVALARLVGRGRRSALGVNGFARGGFLIEGGKRADGDVAPLVARADFPGDWAIVLVIPRDLRGEHGAREVEAFRDLSGAVNDLGRTDALCRLVLLGMLPAVAERDLDGFGEALYDFNRRAGEVFRPWQGDLYAHRRVTELVAQLRAEGVRGVGQSSWGPAVYAVVTAVHAADLRAWLMRRQGYRADEVIVTAACNCGAETA